MAHDDSMCDIPCEGDSTQVCGGKSKSSIFSMHMCNTLEADLSSAKENLATVMGDLDTVHLDLTDLMTGMEDVAAALQTTFGQAGDPVSSNLMQIAKVFTGDILENVIKVVQEILFTRH